ncbi:hypothetical protein [Clostridium sp. HBUAS56017]|uniref:hypothetical protein n=1 Tax=Clostridium sp. HBUAS56017 TaxID=2571128 RepID=UPI0011785134|nr:hypothetical protein [Clostridium sp. HBUAS56017]
MCEKEKLEIEQLLEHFRAGVSEEVKDFTINTALKSSRYLFIRKEIYNMHLNGRAVKQKRYFAYCTHCKKEYEISGELSYKDWCIIKHSLELRVEISQGAMAAVDKAIENLDESKYSIEKVKKQRKELGEEKRTLERITKIVDEFKEYIGR